MEPVNTNATTRPKPRPIFVVGYMHSGTTLLRKIIGHHPEVYSIRAETMFFEQLMYALPARYSDISDDTVLEEYVRYLIKKTTFDWPPMTRAEAELEPKLYQPDEDTTRRIIFDARKNRDYTAVFDHVFSAIAAADGKSRWLEKTPSHIFHVDAIIQAMPEARIVELVRDPRDVLASKKVRKQSDWSERYGDHVGARMQVTKGYDPLRDSLGWRAAIRAGNEAAQQYPGAILRVRYEDLVVDPEGKARHIADFLDLSFHASMLAVSWSNTTVQNGGGAAAGIDRRAVGKWQGKLSPDVVNLCQMINKEEMESLGYALNDVPLSSRAVAPYWLARSGADLLRRYYELWQARGLDYVQGMVRNSWRRVGHLAKR